MRRTDKSKDLCVALAGTLHGGRLHSLLHDKTRPSRIPPLASGITERVVTLAQAPPTEATHWTSAMMAKVVGISASSVQRIWRAHGLQPHRVKQFKLSTDPRFVDKLRDVVGLYVDPPAHAVVLSVDEKSQIQALDRTQPGLPMKKGRAGTMTHDYKRHGTTTLFAALNVATGKVIGECLPRHRAKEFLMFLKKINRETLPYLDLHLIVDNYGTHKTPAVIRWLKRHPRFKLHFTPTSCSWLNLVERLFAEITRQRIRRGTFNSVSQLEVAIAEWIKHRNAHPKPFIWTAKAKPIIAKCRRAQKVLANLAAGCK